MQCLLRCLVCLFVAMLLQACGGGGGGGDGSSPVAAVNQPPIAVATAASPATAGQALLLDAQGSADPEGAALTYQWTLTSAPTGSRATLASADQARPAFVPDLPGSYGFRLMVNDGQADSVPTTLSVDVTAAGVPQIVANATEPLADTVQLSLQYAPPGLVTWFIDLKLLATGTSIAWDTRGVADGAHLVTARIQTGPDTVQELRRTMDVKNPTISLDAQVTGNVVRVSAASPQGITSVQVAVNGSVAGTLTAPNECSRFFRCQGGANDIYSFTVDTSALPSGTYTVVVTATDPVSTRALPRVLSVSHPPVITLAAPGNGTIVSGRLVVNGTTATDKAGALNVTVQLDDVVLLRTGGGNFSTGYDLAGVPAGSHLVNVTATDADGAITGSSVRFTVSASAARAYAPAFTLPALGRVLAVDGDVVLFQAGQPGAASSIVLHDLATGTERVLQAAATAYNWQLSGGYVYANSSGADCISSCIYQWTLDGVRRNLTAANPLYGGLTRQIADYEFGPVARGRYVVWTGWNQLGGYVLFDASTGTYRAIARPADANYVSNNNYDLGLSGATVYVAFIAATGGSGTNTNFDLYRWDSVSGASTRLTPGGQQELGPATDGERIAWKHWAAAGAATNTYTLSVQSTTGGGASTPSTTASAHLLKDGVLAWTESAAGSKPLRYSTAATAGTIDGNAKLLANGGGIVVYAADDGAYSWNVATGTSTRRTDYDLDYSFISNDVLVFQLGQQVYRVAL